MATSEESNTESQPPSRAKLSVPLQYIKDLGLYFEEYNIPPIGGEILGLLSVAPQPLSQDEIMAVLEVSRSSISTNLRSLLMAGLVERVSVVGERGDYYVFSDNALTELLDMRLQNARSLRETVEAGIASLTDDHPARQRVQAILQWAGLLEKAYQEMLERWQSKAMEEHSSSGQRAAVGTIQQVRSD